MNFIDRAEDDEREDGNAHQFFPRPIDSPAERDGEQHATRYERDEVLRLIPHLDADLLDLRTGERREEGDGCSPERDQKPCANAEPGGDNSIHGRL